MLKKYIFCLLLVIGPLASVAAAQVNQDYFKANQLFRQQEYKEAYKIFQQLFQENPGNFTFLEKATECLINLKEYEKAISLIDQAEKEADLQPQANIQRGEIYHVKGDTTKALSMWNNVLKDHAQNRQAYIEVARTMKDRRAYRQAVEVYKQINTNFSNSSLVVSELADTYLLAGQYEKAISHFLQLVQNNPNQINYVQNRLLRFQDENIYEIAITELDDFLSNSSSGHPSYQSLRQLEVWLLMERNHFQRAVKTARTFEEQTAGITYLLYNLGDKLQAEKQFELAEQAFTYYINHQTESVKSRSMEEVAELYTAWGQYLNRHNVGLSSRPQQLFQQAFEILEQLRTETPAYQRMDRVLIALTELALDFLHQPEKARQFLNELKDIQDSSLAAQQQYLEGRLYLYEKDYNRARIAFTGSNDHNDIGSLSEKNRYYLALTDFYAEDYEFARIQLNALQRQNSSYFANDAVQLRLWIQEGLQADSSGEALHPLARAIEDFSRGEYEDGINQLEPLLQNFSNPLADKALLELSTHKKPENAHFVYRVLTAYLATAGSSTPLYERLLWERARLADQIIRNDDFPDDSSEFSAGFSPDSSLIDNYSNEELSVPDNIEKLIALYEEILINFPNGFYASYVRDRIQKLQN